MSFYVAGLGRPSIYPCSIRIFNSAPTWLCNLGSTQAQPTVKTRQTYLYWHCHRHTFASRLDMAGVDQHTVEAGK
jgi:hypothetical protein